MARQETVDIQNKFTRGLITEATGLTFPKDAATEAWNCTFDETGRVQRRLGLDIETDGVVLPRTQVVGEAYSEFVWSGVGSLGDVSYLVKQAGNLIGFYDISEEVDNVSDSQVLFVVSLLDFRPVGSTLVPGSVRCSFSQGAGYLVIANAHCAPILVEWDEKLSSLAYSRIDLKARDFLGVVDGLRDTERLTFTVASLKAGNPFHYYNLLNQGWHTSDALAQWDTARADVPSNADTVGLFRLSQTDPFDAALVSSKTAGNSLAPKGHFILDVFAPKRNEAMSAESFTGANVSQVFVQKTTPVGTPFSGTYGSAPNVVEYAGFSYPSATTASYFRVTATNISSQPQTMVAYTKNGVPVSGSIGTAHFYTYFPVGTSTQTIYLTSGMTPATHIYVIGVDSMFTGVSVSIFEPDPTATEEPLTYLRPSTTAFYAGRAWYAGVDGLGLNNSVFFSQIIERKDQFGRCFQVNDPTSEYFPDILPSDGGVVKIPEAGRIHHIGAYANGLLVFASNGVWAITGSSRNYFTATNLGVRNISGIGTSSGSSFVNVKGLPVWWGESGIYTVRHDPNYDAYSVESLTDESIFGFINNIPPANRNFVKGTYHIDSEQITWVYNAQETLPADKWSYDHFLTLNVLAKSFYPSSIGTFPSGPLVRGVVVCKAAGDIRTARLKFACTTGAGDFFAELLDDSYADWSSFTPGGVDFESYFITGHTLEGQAIRKMQPTYVFIFCEPNGNSGIDVQGVFDWHTDKNSGRWSTKQDGYNADQSLRSLHVKRLKIRGEGRNIQLRFSSRKGKSFSLIGWAIWKTINAGV